jgi:MerR family transcriptional regulator, light-induced transcriptional regulator
MATYSIRDLEKLSGIKAHTIRIWEERYNLIEPKRTTTNIRFYSDDDLKRLLNVSILNQNGLKISRIALLSDERIGELVTELNSNKPSLNTQIENLIVAMLEFDEFRFLSTIEKAISEIGFEEVVEKILFPFLERIGVLWLSGSIYPAQEHFMSNLIRQKMIAAIDHENVKPPMTPQRIIFFLPEGENHELGLLYYSYLARKSGFETIYLGSSVPYRDLLEMSRIYSAQYYFTFFVTSIGADVIQQKMDQLGKDFRDSIFFVSGFQIKELQPRLPSNFRVVSSSETFRQMLKDLLQR